METEVIEINISEFAAITTVVIILLSIAVRCYVRRIKEICETLEHANDLMKQAIDDASEVIKKQDNEIRVLLGQQTKQEDDTQHNSEETEKLPVTGDNWHLYEIRRSDNAPELGLNDITLLFVVARSHSHAMDFALLEQGFVQDNWWDVNEISLCEKERGVIFVKCGVMS